ncbi:MAG: DUF262 domain-containing protein [Candidatus Onthomorpha sp.]|nr:DUF262 domain-containing protein [Candidatus Onthomorpha sp.]
METIIPLTTLTIRNLLSESEYRIPIYQRNYAWGVAEVTQLIQDVADYAKENQNDNYYVGTLVVFPHESENYYETIDGQQRTTTLTIIACSICHNYVNRLPWYKSVNISFDYRDRSNETLRAIYRNGSTHLNLEQVSTEIMSVYNCVWNIIEKECKNRSLSVSDFIDYLFSKVIILRVSVPSDTDLNHYFEIMNSRGEQLEQHEIVKALLMSILRNTPEAMRVFSLIWDACSNMGRYVQMNISKSIRGYFFKDNGIDDIEDDFDTLSTNLASADWRLSKEEKSLTDLFKDDLQQVQYTKPWEEQSQDKEQPEYFGSVISFSNFLLHVLKVIYPNNENVVLDDKKLISIFSECYKAASDKDVKDFIMKLLKIRYLFDKYVIKRKFEKWGLKQIKLSGKDQMYYGSTFRKIDNEEENFEKDVIMLQAMFHVSLPSQIYKHWLSAVLLYAYHTTNITSSDFSNYLWSLAKSYMLDRYLAKEDSVHSFEEIIYYNYKHRLPQNNSNNIDWSNINIDIVKKVGEKVENFVFNFYDFILWKEQKTPDFEFAYRTSVEHFYPQHPIDNKLIEFEYLHSFGNLCLVSNSMNSKFSNSLPAAKYSNFGTDRKVLSTYSVKLQNMMQSMRDHDKWDENKIKSEADEAKSLLMKYLSQ